MKIKKVPIELNGTRYLVFDMNAHYDLSQRFGSLQQLLGVIRSEDMQSLAYIIQVGLAHEEEIPLIELELFIDLDNVNLLTMQILQALIVSLPDSDKFEKEEPDHSGDEEWDWDWLDYIGTVLLGMSEAVFWRTQPRRFFALWANHRRFNGLDGTGDGQVTPNKSSPSWIDQYI